MTTRLIDEPERSATRTAEPTQAIETTAVFDGPWSSSTRAFYARVWRGLDDAGIPYTFHWGKIHALDGPRVRRMYTDAAVDPWLTARKTLLDTPKLRKVFSNQWLRELGMDA